MNGGGVGSGVPVPMALAEHRAKIIASSGGRQQQQQHQQSSNWALSGSGGGGGQLRRPSPIGAVAGGSSRRPKDAHGAGARKLLDHGSDGEEDDSASVRSDDNESESETVSDCSVDEIPVWIKGEQRWISGVTDETTCADLIEVLVQQEQEHGTAAAPVVAPLSVKDYCITERWRQVEQVLDRETKIWQIWTAWGKAQPEVKFILRRADGSHGTMASDRTTGTAVAGATATTTPLGGERDRDSGRGSPTGSINSAIVRRKRHRAQKSTFAWMTHGQTIHPKSSKTSIERLMKLILEQGDIIQQQLSKLRDRELQISTIEEERHRLREREHGKNYLLETYLKGLSEATETDPNALDSGITSEATTTASPEMDFAPENDSDHSAVPGAATTTATGTTATTVAPPEEDPSVKEQIQLLEKIVSLNKRIQREEESAVKLFERIRRYQLEDPPDQARIELEDALTKVNASIDRESQELHLIDESLHKSDELLRERTELLRSLTEELLQQDNALEDRAPDAKVIMDFSQPNPVMRVDRRQEQQQQQQQQPSIGHTGTLGPSRSTFKPSNYPTLYPIAEAVGPGEPAKIVIASSTLPRNFQRPALTVPVTQLPTQGRLTVPDATGISVHQINKFIQCSNNLGTNCNTNRDDKICPKQLFHSAVSATAGECQQLAVQDHDLTNMGTLV
ncbi:ras association domain-containing protein 10-like [Anopheles aquasalis]|uniref:ras association domain-containing protein 10-like n=1 Tax=Anopheles aquasalis TaxID=42839 RepID=UPI00215B2325|nr:ras association domain-containing protein 10-like [Anopheles aquasalis]XP_050091688.1 ras association domain-containing protein 10-like [Anopheles aquasalis]XP_050091689.1 ras association domain-containing protein 10-like [Anopheles aquasalis]